jgi:hypothetical protein
MPGKRSCDYDVPLASVNLPSGVRGLASVERLGGLCDVLDPRLAEGRARTWLVILGLPGLVLVSFTAVFVAERLLWAAGLGLLLVAGYLGAAGRILVRDILPGYGRVLYRFDNGLILATRRTVTAFPWDAVSEVRVSGVRRVPSDAVSWRFGVRREDGEEAEIGSEFPGVRALVEVVSREVTERILPKYVSRVEAGGKVRIGPFTVTREGIAKDGERVVWEDVGGVQISNGMVQVDRADRLAGMTATAGEVPNAVAFAELARYLRSLRADYPPTERGIE